ncbi:hypothetical protein ACFSMW_11135 [Virgibacillus halophilus]|uniref:Yip1 domain-containing protein n=1 Tax=Tigheibacillus halophilus TaxID=361280 RepID=A0ABU5C8S1_9BACI|nr:hypothetical protein [Virgibacillus halophilus]
MNYDVNIFKLLFRMEDSIFRINETEKIQNLWKSSLYILLAAIAVYVWMAYLGIGSGLVSEGAIRLAPAQYTVHKFWFVIGRLLYAILFWGFTLFVPAVLFNMVTEIPFQKLVIIQQLVFAMLIVERLIWIPLAIYAGLDWYSSPMSFGIIAAYLTSRSWIIYFFGAISIFQIWIIFLQVRYIHGLCQMPKRGIWASVIFLHVFEWGFAALFSSMDSYMIGGWFG